ncbi:unnamed protein product, partial [Mesorhabditis spiculigera]
MDGASLPKRQKLASILENKFRCMISADVKQESEEDLPSTSPSPPSLEDRLSPVVSANPSTSQANHPTLSSLLSAPLKAQQQQQQAPNKPQAAQQGPGEEAFKLYAQCTSCRIYMPDQNAFIQHVLLHYPAQFRILGSKREAPSSPKIQKPLSVKPKIPEIESADPKKHSMLRSLLGASTSQTTTATHSPRLHGNLTPKSEASNPPKPTTACGICGEIFPNVDILLAHNRECTPMRKLLSINNAVVVEAAKSLHQAQQASILDQKSRLPHALRSANFSNAKELSTLLQAYNLTRTAMNRN